MKTLEVVAAVIQNNENKILIAKRSTGKYQGLWEFPGGKIKLNETHQQALAREIMEELNIEIAIKEYICTSTHDDEDAKINLHVYWAQPLTDNVKLSAHSEYKWIDKKDVINYNWSPVDMHVLNFIK